MAKAALAREEARTPFTWEGNFASLSPKQEDVIVEPVAPSTWEGRFEGLNSKGEDVVDEPSSSNSWEDNFEGSRRKQDDVVFEPSTPRVWEGNLAGLISRNEDIIVTFHNLDVEEDQLTEQKEVFAAQLNQLRVRAVEEVEKKKQKVEALTSEVSDLKQRCAELADWINSE